MGRYYTSICGRGEPTITKPELVVEVMSFFVNIMILLIFT